MTRYGLDMLYPPTVAQAAAMQDWGATFCGVYVGGPRAAAHSAWHQQDDVSYPVRDLVPYFTDGFLPIYVGRNVPWDKATAFTFNKGVIDGSDANVQTGACGFDSTSPIVLDVEAGTYEKYPKQVRAYLLGFVSVCNAAGHRVYLYSDPATIAAVGTPDVVDGTWGADWSPATYNFAPVGFYDPSLPPPWDAWQFGGGLVGGVQCDYDSAVDTLQFAQYAL